MLCLGARVTGVELALEIVRAFVAQDLLAKNDIGDGWKKFGNRRDEEQAVESEKKFTFVISIFAISQFIEPRHEV